MKKIFILLAFILSVYTLRAQDARSLFGKMPESVLPLLTEINRADFLDFLDSKMKAEVKNKLSGTSEMTALTSDYIHIRISEQSTWEMKVLEQAGGTKIICTVSTVCAPVCDSRIGFFSAEWKPLDTKYIAPPVMDDFFRKPQAEDLYDYGMLRAKADILFMKAEVSKEDHSLTFTFTTPGYMVKEDAEKLEKYLNPAIRYEWEDRKSVV